VPVPADPHVVVQETLESLTQGNVSSGSELQSLSSPSQISVPVEHSVPVGISQASVQIPVPGVPQVVVHATEAPRTHAKPSSARVSQSSSRPLHVSAGGVHEEGAGRVQVEEQVPVPVELQVVVHGVGLDMTQGSPSSGSPLQLSSRPLHTSTPALQSVPVGIPQPTVHVPVPVDPQSVVQETGLPAAQSKPLSGPSTQSSSSPLQVSTGGTQAVPEGVLHPIPHTPVPVDTHVVVHTTVSPKTHSNPSSERRCACTGTRTLEPRGRDRPIPRRRRACRCRPRRRAPC